MNYMLYKTPVVSKFTYNFMEPVKRIYDLANDISNENISVSEANKKSIDIMIEYNVTNESTVNDLIKLKKIENVSSY